MRILVLCGEGCQRQYDASKLSPGSRFHCACGEVLTVPLVAGFETAVVRCSSCGAPRQGGESTCRHCSAAFTLAEQDLQTVCPTCMTRVSDQARFCHHCSRPLVAEGVGGEVSEQPCPACRDEARLFSRRLGDEAFAMMECRRCAGIWLGVEAFSRLEERAQGESVLRKTPPLPPTTTGKPAPIQYRPCPTCGKLMYRRNYGRRSGMIIDACSDHGFWFDHEELERILQWIRGGGLDHAKARQTEEHRVAARDARAAKAASSGLGGTEPEGRGWLDVASVLGDVFSALL